MLQEVRDIIHSNIIKFQQQSAENIIFQIVTEKVNKWVKSVSNPEIICLAGLPGSGKTEFAKRNFIDSSYFVLDPDEYRQFVLLCGKIKKPNIDNTQTFMLAVSYSLLEIAIYVKTNILVLDTFTDWEGWLKWFDLNSKYTSDYKIKLIILAQPLSLCKYGMTKRYHDEKQSSLPYVRSPDIHFLIEESKLVESAINNYLIHNLFDESCLLGRNLIEDKYTQVHCLDLVKSWKDITFYSENTGGNHE